MPFIHITTARELSPEDRQTLAERSTDLIVELLGKRREVTAVLIDHAENGHWTINGKVPAAPPAHCEIAITEGTNDHDSIAQTIAAMRDLLDETMGGLAEASYVIIRTPHAAHWGYNGRTQAARRQDGSTKSGGLLSRAFPSRYY